MEEHKSTAGQGLGIAGLIMGIIAIVFGIIPCTFYIGIVFGIIGIVLSLVALSQANRGYGPKGLIIGALVCSILGFTVSAISGFVGTHFLRTIRDELRQEEPFNDFGRSIDEIMRDIEDDEDTIYWEESSGDLEHMTDTLKALEGEEDQTE